MVPAPALAAALVFASFVALVSTVPYGLTAIDYRRRDNGLAYLLLVIGVAVWNLLFVAQVLSSDPLVDVFFLALSVVGAVLAGLGFLLFATTASSTSGALDRRAVYATVGVLGGLDIVFAVTAPVHPFYWSLPTPPLAATVFAVVDPGTGYWLHTAFLGVLFLVGMGLFADPWRSDPGDRFLLGYVVAAGTTAVAVVASNVLAPGGLGVGQVVVLGLTTVGWLQAARGEPLAWLRPTG